MPRSCEKKAKKEAHYCRDSVRLLITQGCQWVRRLLQPFKQRCRGDAPFEVSNPQFVSHPGLPNTTSSGPPSMKPTLLFLFGT